MKQEGYEYEPVDLFGSGNILAPSPDRYKNRSDRAKYGFGYAEAVKRFENPTKSKNEELYARLNSNELQQYGRMLEECGRKASKIELKFVEVGEEVNAMISEVETRISQSLPVRKIDAEYQRCMRGNGVSVDSSRFEFMGEVLEMVKSLPESERLSYEQAIAPFDFDCFEPLRPRLAEARKGFEEEAVKSNGKLLKRFIEARDASRAEE